MGLMIYLKAVCMCVSVWLYYRKQDFKRDDNILIEFVLSDEVELLSCVRLFATPWTVAYNAPPAMGFSRQEYWSGLPFGYFFFIPALEFLFLKMSMKIFTIFFLMQQIFFPNIFFLFLSLIVNSWSFFIMKVYVLILISSWSPIILLKN